MADKLLTFGEVSSDGGFAAVHALPSLPLYVAPSTRDDFATKNAARWSLNPIACWRLDDARFEFDSSFVLPEATEELATLGKMVTLQPDAPLSIFGHTDPVGSEKYNVVLGARRARAIHAVLTRDVDAWVSLHDHAHGGDDWAAKKVDGRMLGALGYSSKTEDVKQFQTDQGLADDGKIGKDTRKALIQAYMDFLSPTVKLKKAAFLGGGQSDKLKGDLQSCGEFNPILLLSKKENDKLPPEKRNVENSPNRRVVVFFYEPGTTISPDDWPCPAAPMKDGEASGAIKTCEKRFWSDEKDRRAPKPDERRAFKETHDTFGCRFYHRNAGWSPCEGGQVVKHWVVRLVVPDGPPAGKTKPLANEPFVAKPQGGGGKQVVGTTDDAGILRVRVHEDVTTLEVKIADQTLVFSGGILQDVDDAASPKINLAVKQRLFNLGYGAPNPDNWSPAEYDAALRLFQKQQAIDPSEAGTIGPLTRAKLKNVHGG